MLLDPVVFPVFIAIVAIVILAIFFHFVPFFLWLSAKVSGVHISLIQLFLMRIRNVPPGVIVPSLIEAHKAGLKNITRDNLEAHYMTGGHVQRVVHALVSASKANIDLPFEKATAIDLAGRDVFEAVQTSVNPKVIDTPPVAAVAKNGIQLIAKARVTVRANIHQLVGGAGEDTIAKVEGGVMAAGPVSAILEQNDDPEALLRTVMSDFDLKILETCPVSYKCYCSRQRVERALISLGKSELEQMLAEQGGCQLTCQFCDAVYDFSADDLRALIAGL